MLRKPSRQRFLAFLCEHRFRAWIEAAHAQGSDSPANSDPSEMTAASCHADPVKVDAMTSDAQSVNATKETPLRLTLFDPVRE